MRTIFILILLLFNSVFVYSQFLYSKNSTDYLILPIGYNIKDGMKFKKKIKTRDPGLTRYPDFISQLNKLIEKAREEKCQIIRITEIFYLPPNNHMKEQCKLIGECYTTDSFQEFKSSILKNKNNLSDTNPKIYIYRPYYKRNRLENFKYDLLIDNISYNLERFSDYKQNIIPSHEYVISIPKYNLTYKFKAKHDQNYYLSCYFRKPATAPQINSITISVGGYLPQVNLIENEMLGELLYSQFKNDRKQMYKKNKGNQQIDN